MLREKPPDNVSSASLFKCVSNKLLRRDIAEKCQCPPHPFNIDIVNVPAQLKKKTPQTAGC